MAQMQGKFWLVWRHPPLPEETPINVSTRKHSSLHKAMAEATRLDKKVGGIGIYAVMECVGVVHDGKQIHADDFIPPKKPKGAVSDDNKTAST